MADSINKVTIVGAGLAGLTASLRLLERGFQVTLYEQDDFVGGMMHAYRDPRSGAWREHSYHMYSNWYHNFWKITEELGVRDNFAPKTKFKYLYQGQWPYMTELVNAGGIQDFWRNIFSGAAEPADIFIYMYSQVDLLSKKIDVDDEFLDQFSVNGFMASRPYATDGAAEIHQQLWETVWAVPSFNASAKSYQTFLKYGNRLPVPDYWMLKGNKWDNLIGPWLAKLESFDGFELKPLHRLKKITPTADRTAVKEIVVQQVSSSPSINVRDTSRTYGPGDPPPWEFVGDEIVVNTEDQSVIMAVTPGMMAKMVEGELYNADPSLGSIRYLEAEPMGSVSLHLKTDLPDTPTDICVLMDANFEMTFLDYSKSWPDVEKPYLCVTVSDAVALCAVHAEKRDADGKLVINLERPETAIDYILQQLLKNVPIELEDIDLEKTSAEMNTGEELFANLVGSWAKRPETSTELDNLFLAGTYVRNYADVATVEGGVASGLQAAEAVRIRHATGEPVELIIPDEYPRWLYTMYKWAWAPYAAYAKAWSMATHTLGLTQRPPTHWDFYSSDNPYSAKEHFAQKFDFLRRQIDLDGDPAPSSNVIRALQKTTPGRRSRRNVRR